MNNLEDFPGGPVVKTMLPMQGVQFRSLVGELRSHLLYGAAKKDKKKGINNMKFRGRLVGMCLAYSNTDISV